MLVFISDLHFSDGTASGTLNPRIFRIFSGLLQDIIERSTPEYLRLVFLGDIFDLLRTDYWTATSLRPWSSADQLEKVIAEITQRIIEYVPNKESISNLVLFGRRIAANGIPFSMEYLPGNHDRLVNMCGKAIKAVSEFLGIENSLGSSFPVWKLWEDHRAFARHGEIYDPLNYEADGKASLGDAIVIELLSRFSEETKKEFSSGDASGMLAELSEIDNVRPLIDIPAYINGVCRKHGGDDVARRVKKIWDRLASEFVKLAFISERNKWLRWDIVNTLKATLFMTRKFSNGRIANLLSNERLRDLFRGDAYMAKKAGGEEPLKAGMADFVIYGHTHRQAMVPLTGWDDSGSTHESFYFNTGTWRRVFQKARQGRHRNDFARWNELTFVCIFKDGERVAADGTQRRFETWTASLG